MSAHPFKVVWGCSPIRVQEVHLGHRATDSPWQLRRREALALSHRSQVLRQVSVTRSRTISVSVKQKENLLKNIGELRKSPARPKEQARQQHDQDQTRTTLWVVSVETPLHGVTARSSHSCEPKTPPALPQ